MGYRADVAVREDHRIVEQRVTPNATDPRALVPWVDAVEQRCGKRPQRVSADRGFFKLPPIVKLVQRGIDV